MVKPLQHILILGGGSAGWMTAAALGKVLDTSKTAVTLVESDDIGTVGVGEATIPQLMLYNDLIGLDEDEFVRETGGTFKLGIQFTDWDKIGSKYFHAFGELGKNMEGVHFYQYWLRMQQQGLAGDLDDYSLASQACLQKKFMRPIDAGNSPLSKIAYAFHFDAGLYARYLRKLAEGWGVKRIEGKVDTVQQHENGDIASVTLENGDALEADFFIDCSGFRALLIEQTLNAGFDDWQHWLPCDRAVTVGTARNDEPWPFTRAAAQQAGWQWRIPLQHRTGNGHVYSSKFMSDDDALDILKSNLDGDMLGEPRLIKFRTGMRRKSWSHNCLAVGLSSGFMEPLESTSLHLIQVAISKFFSFFPHQGQSQQDVDEFNRQMCFEYEAIRDFLILHYHATSRTDTPFWRYCKTMDIPDELQRKMDLFEENGRIFRFNNELFNDISWFEVMYGQGLRPRGYHALANRYTDEQLTHRLEEIRGVIRRSADYMPSHDDYIREHCQMAQ
ncbi:tryptophan halogenase family protein [Alteromonas sp. H39]|uniref:tryptophan halogenase family protein n=1 Tax=Alteromonas sp. H39 TaxID=3389876 RepID=UPI0039E13D4A